MLLLWDCFAVTKPLSQIHRSTLWPLQDANQTPSLGGFGLRGNGLSGSIPAGLDSLRQLILSDNELSGEIPAELGGLSALEDLYLSGNDLTGCIPATLRDIPNHDLVGLRLLYCEEPAA